MTSHHSTAPPTDPPTASPNVSARPTPLWAPLYGASASQAVQRFFTKYANFTGRASRSEFWWCYLFNAIVLCGGMIVIGALSAGGGTVNGDGTTNPGPLYWLPALFLVVWTLGTFVPQLALLWRRLHDTNRSGLFVFFGLIPSVGGILVLCLAAERSNPAGARFDRPRAYSDGALAMKPRDELFSREHRYSLGIDEESGRHFASLPVSNGAVDYEEYYGLTEVEYAQLLADPAKAVEFIEQCRLRQHDGLLLQQPGWNRGTAV